MTRSRRASVDLRRSAVVRHTLSPAGISRSGDVCLGLGEVGAVRGVIEFVLK